MYLLTYLDCKFSITALVKKFFVLVNVFENHFLNRDNLGKMQLKTRKNGSSSTELEQYMKQSVFLYCYLHCLQIRKKSGLLLQFAPFSIIFPYYIFPLWCQFLLIFWAAQALWKIGRRPIFVGAWAAQKINRNSGRFSSKKKEPTYLCMSCRADSNGKI